MKRADCEVRLGTFEWPGSAVSKMVIGGRFISESVELDLIEGGASFVGGGLTILREAEFPKIFVKS